MSRFYVPNESIKDKEILISGGQAHHILNVLRLKRDDEVVTFDGTGKEYIGFIKETKKKSLIIEITRTREVAKQNKLDITLVQAIPKKGKMDYIIEKATELGVHRIAPIHTERCIVNLKSDRAKGRVSRWKRIAQGSAQQCGRQDVPKIDEVRDIDDLLDEVAKHDLAMIACLQDGTKFIKEVLRDFRGKSVIAFIGPEGDFTSQEIEKVVSKGAKPISLGPRVLKSDTAGLVILSILNYEIPPG